MLFESTLSSPDAKGSAPFIRLIIPFTAGILLQYYLDMNVYAFLLVIPLLIFSWLYQRLRPDQRFRLRAWQALLLWLFLFFVGAFRLYMANLLHHPASYPQFYTQGDIIQLEITEPPQVKTNSISGVAHLKYILHNGQIISPKGKINLYADKRLKDSIRWGSLLYTNNTLMPMRNQPESSFDYQRYCADRGIYHQVYIPFSGYHPVGLAPVNGIRLFLHRAAGFCTATFNRYVGPGPEAGMAAALLIGDRQGLDKDLVKDYSNTGIVHVIAISGMHLSLLYASLLLALSWLPAGQRGDLLKAVLVLLFLWGFTFLTGASASVLRAAVMFTATTLGQFVLARKSNIFNSLAASAFILLAVNPYLVMDTGFQLSYLAVLSIILFQPKIYAGLHCKNKWLDYLWQMAALTLAAQLLTTPLCLYYYHQFPTWFLLANLVAVPLSTIIIYGEILLLLVVPVPLLAGWLGRGVHGLIWLMDLLVKWIGELPLALITNIPCNKLMLVLLYLALAAMALYWYHRFREARLAMICCLNFTLLVLLYLQWHPVSKPYHLKHYTLHHGKRLVNVTTSLPDTVPVKKFRTNYILLSRNPPVDIRQIAALYDFDTLVIGTGNSKRRIEQWKNDCYVLTLRFISVPDQGAYVINF
ncbi:ComEC/Rec2 family competence protein [Chitinophaga sp. sic0106]|uniref:ComEC/Rec2 family competence protein n=1 Tax=Chitinophaga sp. sic0106 TaxID=2854785 RepID=UPI001C436BA5|nr:ComEC/Rec2 family competence protein [Chitinophaga sp. sic0106]MBV7528872.1 ComEC family competence protein [Chitinophaga sp. sic0106]